MRLNKGIIFSALLLVFIVGFLVFVFAETGLGIWTTDSGGNIKTDFAPEETVLISGDGFSAASASTPINIQVTRPDSSVHVCPDPYWCPNPLPTTSSFSSYPYLLDGIEGTYIIDASDGTNVVRGSFTDSATYTVESYSSNTYSVVKNNFVRSETVYGKGTRSSAANMRLRYRNPSNNVVKTCSYSNSDVVYCDYALPSDAPTGEWDIQIGRCDKNCNQDCNWEWTGYGTDHFNVAASCTPNCVGKVCGSDGCGGSCGTCSSGYTCNGQQQCVPIITQTPSVTIIADKIVCNSESDLPNWGGGSNDITATTASDYITNHPNCHLESGWNFQWAFDASNPGDNLEHAGQPWTTFGPTASNGRTNVVIDNAHDTIWLREELKSGYIPFSNNLQDAVTAEFYCDGDVLNYDNYDFIDDQIANGNTYYCVGFNALIARWGDGVVNGNEQCDDGNTNNGDCCSSTCQYEQNGAYCGSARDCLSDACNGAFAEFFPDDGHDTCNGAGTCNQYSCTLEKRYCTDNNPQDGINSLTCGATCDQNSDCAPHLSGDYCDYTGSCNLQTDCGCDYKGHQYCPVPGTVVGTGADAICYYGTQSCTENGCGGLLTAPMLCNNYCDPLLGPKDNQGPVTSNLISTKVIGQCKINIGADETDTCSNVAAAEYFIDGSGCGVPGTGTPMIAKDGSFDNLFESVTANNVIVSDGRINVYVRGKDDKGNWGACQAIAVDIDCIPPDTPTCNVFGGGNYGADLLGIDGTCTPGEKLVCGRNVNISANICDSQSRIQMAEYFLNQNCSDPSQCLNWQGINMTASDGSYDQKCENVNAIINTSLLSDGTHYIQLHGKDGQENWGKFILTPIASFIRDTTAPKTEKTLTPNGISVPCYGTEPIDANVAEKGVLTDGCAYVKAGTTVTLTANDFNPDNQANGGYNKLPGEYADKVIIHWIVWYKLNPTDTWTISQQGVGVENQDVIITLTQDSYHLVEYWAEDACDYAETHHFELDIVDTQAPVTTKEILGPKYVSGDKTYVDGVTQIKLTCTDPQPHPVDNVKIYYRYKVDDGSFPSTFTEYTTPFPFPEESQHVLEYYCVDALGNQETTHTETYYVDHTKPVTTKTYGTPLVEAVTGGYPKWITSQTPITLTTVDPDTTGHGCNSGVKETKYRVSLVEDGCCLLPVLKGGDLFEVSPCIGSGTWDTYSSPFTIPQESCHLIEYSSVDNVDKTEDVKMQYVYVDNSKPVTTKTVGEPKYYKGDSYDWWITQQTSIELSCVDPQPHPVDAVTLHAKYKVDGSSAWIPLTTIDGSVKFTFPEDSIHTLEWYCEDALGNTEATRTEIDNVDSAPPEIVKWVDDNTVKPGDTVKICANVTDKKLTPDPGVGVDWVKAHLTLGDDLYDVDLINTEGNTYCGNWIAPEITGRCHEYKCLWELNVEATDFLGNHNTKDGIQIIVDKADPEIKYVLNPVSGRYYRDGKPFSVYAPAIDFGGDKNIFNYDNCKASGVLKCRFYAVDYPYETIEQIDVKNYWDYLHELGDVFSHGHIVELGSVPYVNGVCKGTVSLPKDSGITDKAFLAYEIEDNAGNIKEMELAEDANGDYILMDIDNEGPMVSIRTDVGVGNGLAVLTSEDNVRLQANIIDYESGFDECWADLLICNSACTDTGIDLTGHALDYNLCEINGILPNGLESGIYTLKVNARDEQFNIGSAEVVVEVDNTRPTMTVIDPLKGEIYGEVIPVSLDVEDSSGIADESVKVRISELPAIGNLFCIFGSCEDTGWVLLSKVGDLYSKDIDLGYYKISGDGRYVFDAIACDTLYVPDTTTLLGLDINLDRNSMHCRMISQHGAEEAPEPITQCNDGIDNDGDILIDYPADPGCSSSEDDSEYSESI